MKKLLVERDTMGDTEFTNRWKCKDGTWKWIRWHIRYSREEEKYFMTGTDITEVIQIKNERLIYQETLQIERLKSQFLANISHELRTPLNVMYSIMQLVEKEELSNTIEDMEKMKKYRLIGKQNLLRLMRLVDNIMDISKIRAGSFEDKKENYNIVEIIENTVMSAIEYIKNKGLELIFDTQVEEVIMACNPDMIERIMLNLLSNAVKYSDVGKILVNIEVKSNLLIVSVSDTGTGIPEDKLATIFRSFEQVDTSLNRKCEGCGIGLTIVKAFVGIHNGKVYAESQFGKGSKFTLEFPIETIKGAPVKYPLHNISNEKRAMEFADIY